MIEYLVIFLQYSIFSEKVETYYDFFMADSKEMAASMCRWKHGDGIGVEEVIVFE